MYNLNNLNKLNKRMMLTKHNVRRDNLQML